MLSGIKFPSDIGAVIVGDTLFSAVGTPDQNTPTPLYSVTDEPSGSDIFAGLGDDGEDVTQAELDSATFAITGVYGFTATDANGAVTPFSIYCWPAAVLEVAQLKYASYADSRMTTPPVRPINERRSIIKQLALAATKAGAEAVLENSPGAPYYGADPSTLGVAFLSLYSFGGW